MKLQKKNVCLASILGYCAAQGCKAKCKPQCGHFLSKEDPSQTNFEGQTALFFVRDGESAKLLMRYGCDPRKASKGQWTPMHFAIRSDRPGAVRKILSWCDNTVECLMVRSFSGVTPLSLIHTVKTLRICLDYGAPINSIVDAENTLLHIAAMHDRCEMIEELLQRGAKADILNEKGWAASHAAARQGHVRALQAMLRHSSNPDVITQRDKSGKTCLDHAILSQGGNAIMFLLRKDILLSGFQNVRE